MQVYKVLSDAVVLDWYISLSDKDQMSTCDIAYFKSDYLSNSQKATQTERQLRNSFVRQLMNQSIASQVSSSFVLNLKQNGVTFISPYIPTTRTFLVGPLESNLAYVFQMSCVDNDGYGYFSRPLHFTTGNAEFKFSLGSIFVHLCTRSGFVMFHFYENTTSWKVCHLIWYASWILYYHIYDVFKFLLRYYCDKLISI